MLFPRISLAVREIQHGRRVSSGAEQANVSASIPPNTKLTNASPGGARTPSTIPQNPQSHQYKSHHSQSYSERNVA